MPPRLGCRRIRCGGRPGRDPLELRQSLLDRDPNQKAIEVLSIVDADRPPPSRGARANCGPSNSWPNAPIGAPLPAGQGRGLAVHYGFQSVVAMVVAVTVHADGTFQVDRVVCAIDCGVAINPGIVRSQIKGSVAWRLGGMLYGAITLADGVIEQSNYHDYRVLRMDKMPWVEVHIVPSLASPTVVGQCGVATIAPAVANARFAATGERVRSPPFHRPSATR